MAVIESTNLHIEQGTDFEASFDLRKLDRSIEDLTGVEPEDVVGRIRKYPSSRHFKEFQTNLNINDGILTISMSAENTSLLSPGRNTFDVLIKQNEKTRKVIKGTIIVYETASLLTGSESPGDGDNVIYIPQKLEDLVNVGITTSSKKDKYVLMYDATTNKYKLVNPDEVLSASVSTPNEDLSDPVIPEIFANQLDEILDNSIDVDAGGF